MNGLSARIVQSSGAGYVAAAEDPVGLADAIEACRTDDGRARRERWRRARAEQEYERGAILDRLAEILRQSAGIA